MQAIARPYIDPPLEAQSFCEEYCDVAKMSRVLLSLKLLSFCYSVTRILSANMVYVPIPMAVRLKPWACSRSFAEITCSNAAEGMDVYLL